MILQSEKTQCKKLSEGKKPIKKKQPLRVEGDETDLRRVAKLMNEAYPQAGIECTYYDYTYYKGINNVLLKFTKNRRQLLIMTQDVAHKRLNSRLGCWRAFCMSRKKDTIMPKNYDSPVISQDSVVSQNSRSFGKDVSINIKVDLAKLSGFIIGPKTQTFS